MPRTIPIRRTSAGVVTGTDVVRDATVRTGDGLAAGAGAMGAGGRVGAGGGVGAALAVGCDEVRVPMSAVVDGAGLVTVPDGPAVTRVPGGRARSPDR